jgi:hypothetical protein
MTDEPPWLTLTEAAKLSGMNRETICSGARRNLIPARRGNAGQLVVQVPPNPTGSTGSDRGATGAATAPDRGLAEALTELQDELTDLRDQVTRAEEQRDAAREVAEARVAAMERLVRELQAMLAEARRPWWRRWRG